MSNMKYNDICFQYVESGTCRFGSSCKFSHNDAINHGSSKSTKRPEKRYKARRPEGPRSVDNIDGFFAKHHDFDYNSSKPIWTEFNRMCDDFGWDTDDYEMRDARRKFKSAMVQQFNDLYGTDQEDLNSWQNLCRVLKIEPVPEGLKKCRKEVRQTHVNLVDLVDTPRTKVPVEIFSNLNELQDYTIRTEKFFPKDDAYAGGLLKFLLREILIQKRGNL